MAQQGDLAQRFRVAVLLVALLTGAALLLTRCPANRDGLPGQLAAAMSETTTATRSGALALDLWLQRRSTNQLTSVALSDARDDVVTAYQGIADLRADDPVDLQRQQLLTGSMTTIIAQLNTASSVIRGASPQPDVATVRGQLLASAEALESGYR